MTKKEVEKKIEETPVEPAQEVRIPCLAEKLSHIQNEMKVPKNLYNQFGNYYYRNAETIFDTAKPICAKYRTTLSVVDDIEVRNDRIYVCAYAQLLDWDSDQVITGKAYAREQETKKGMDESQITGACSSYARKYALNGLFNLDDVKDADSQDNTKEGVKEKPEEACTLGQQEKIKEMYTADEISLACKAFKKATLAELSVKEADRMIKGKKK